MSELIPQFGNLIWTLAAFIAALSIIVTVHEYGHYIVGRWSGIKAEVFSIGFGPVIASRRDRRGTVWQVAAVPLGGYVRFLGDANAASAGPGQAVDPALRRRTLDGAPLWARFATVAAGPAFNFIFSTLIFAGFALWWGTPTEKVVVGKIDPLPPAIVNELRAGDEILAVGTQPVHVWRDLGAAAAALPPGPQNWRVRRDGSEVVVRGPDPMPPVVTGVSPRSAAVAAGLRPGDVILAIDGTEVSRFTQLREIIETVQGRPVLLRIWREGVGESTVTLAARERDTPAEGGGFERRWLIGISGGGPFFAPTTRPIGPVEALGSGLSQTWEVVRSSVVGVGAMIAGQISSCNLGGAISIADSTAQAASFGADSFIRWIAVLSAAIGFLNLLPVPVLDGGHLAFFTYEAITGRRPSERALHALTALGLALVLSLMIFGLTNDIFCP